MSSLDYDRKVFAKSLWALVVPMAIQNLINVGVMAADVVMLGRLGETAVSASSLAGQVNFILTLFLFGLTSGAAVLTAQYWGKRDIKTIEKVLGITILLAVLTSFIFLVAAMGFSESIMKIFSNEKEVRYYGAAYMRIVAISYIPSAITMVYLNVMRSVEKVTISTMVYLVSLVVNVILNAIFIFGLFGIPKMGVRGAAIATTIARFVELLIVCFYALKKNKLIKVRLKYIVNIDKILLSDYIKYAVPVTANELLWGLGISSVNAIIGHLGKEMVAANSVTNVVRQLAMVVVFGIANATAIMIGKVIGENKENLAKIYAQKLVKLTWILGIISAILIISISPIVRHFMTFNSETQMYLNYMLIILAILVIETGVNTTLIVGVFRAGGDTKVGLMLDVLGLWCVAIPLGMIAAFWLKLPPIAVYLLLACDEIVKFPFTIKRYKSYKWLKNVTRDF